MASKVGNSPIISHKVYSGWTSSTDTKEIKNGINNNHSVGSHNLHTTVGSTDYDDYDFPPDAMDNRPTIYIDSDDSFDSDVDDDYAEPEDDTSIPVKRSASFGKAALHSLKRGFVAKGKIDSSSLHTPLINDYIRANSVGSLQRIKQSTTDHLKVQQSGPAQGTIKKSMKSKSRSNPSFK